MLALDADETECLTVARREWKSATGKRAGYSRYPEKRMAGRFRARRRSERLWVLIPRWRLKAGSSWEAPVVRLARSQHSHALIIGIEIWRAALAESGQNVTRRTVHGGQADIASPRAVMPMDDSH